MRVGKKIQNLSDTVLAQEWPSPCKAALPILKVNRLTYGSLSQDQKGSIGSQTTESVTLNQWCVLCALIIKGQKQSGPA